MKIAVEGCAHGQLDNIYDSIVELEKEEDIKIDLLICCGDFQAVRNEGDLRCMAVPPKYYNMCTFYKYYNGEKEAPVLTIFIGGNHEASNYLQELPFGGWVAPKIYYLGYAGVLNIGDLRIGGISGIYKGVDYMKGHYEITPYSDSSIRSVYHIRNIEIFRLKQLSKFPDIFLSHDWPSEITNYGDKEKLFQIKSFFKDDAESGKLGSSPCNDLLFHLKPKYWFSAHLHCKFAALVDHEDGNTTKFLALDKCLPKRHFLQILDIPNTSNDLDLKYDLEWLTVLYLTDHLFSIKNSTQYMPSKTGQERWNFSPSEEEKDMILKKFGDLKIPNNFEINTPKYSPDNTSNFIEAPFAKINSQTTQFCEKLGIVDPWETRINQNDYLSTSQTYSSVDFSRSFIDTDVSCDFNVSNETVSPVKRTSMVLPAPVNISLESNESENPKNLEIIETKDESEEITENNPATKKFKRRNADIYKIGDE